MEDLIPGSGSRAEDGDELTVEYVGVHYDGAPFTNSWERSKRFSFELGDLQSCDTHTRVLDG